MILPSLIMVLSLVQLVWGNVEVTSHPHWLTEILLLAGVVSLLTAVLLLTWFYLVPRITMGRGVDVESEETGRERLSAAWLILLLLLVSAVTIPASIMDLSPHYPDVVFDSENLTMKVLPNLTEYQMTGHYLIKNPGTRSVPTTLLVPFPETAWRQTTIQLNGTHRSRITQTGKGYEVTYRFHPLETLKIGVTGLRRIQVLENGTRVLRYDVTTTRSWRESLREAVFEITLPVQSQVLGVYPGNWTSETTPEGVKITILEESFMPDRQLTVSFHPSTQPTP